MKVFTNNKFLFFRNWIPRIHWIWWGVAWSGGNQPGSRPGLWRQRRRLLRCLLGRRIYPVRARRRRQCRQRRCANNAAPRPTGRCSSSSDDWICLLEHVAATSHQPPRRKLRCRRTRFSQNEGVPQVIFICVLKNLKIFFFKALPRTVSDRQATWRSSEQHLVDLQYLFGASPTVGFLLPTPSGTG